LNTLKSQVQPETEKKHQTGTTGTTGEKMEEEIKPWQYDVSYSTISKYENGKRDLKERIHVKNPDVEVVADRVPGKDEFDVKWTTKKEGTKDQKLSAHELKHKLDTVYGDMQSRLGTDYKRLGLQRLKPSRSLFGSQDIPMIGPSTTHGALLPVERSFKPFTNLFEEESWNIEREMDMMRRRMENEMSRFF
jgi:hypothetical protein